jgi:hypothetical protein
MKISRKNLNRKIFHLTSLVLSRAIHTVLSGWRQCQFSAGNDISPYFTDTDTVPYMWFIMMVWDYVSELRPSMGLLFIPRVMCERVQPWWWWWCRLGITPDLSTRALWQSYQQRHLGQVGGMDEGVRISPISIWHNSRDLQHAVKSYDMRRYMWLAFSVQWCQHTVHQTSEADGRWYTTMLLQQQDCTASMMVWQVNDDELKRILQEAIVA